MRIAVFGAGGTGAYFGGRLAAAGHEVTLIARGAHLQALRQSGLRLESVLGDVHVRPAATSEPSDVGPVDLVLVGVKTWQVTEAAEAMRPMVGEGTSVLPMQNGVEAPDRLAAVLGDPPVLGGTARIVSFLAGPGHVRHVGGPAAIELGERDGRPSERAQRVRDLLDVPGIKATVSPDIRLALWEKLLNVVPAGGVGAITRAPVGVLRDLPETRRLLDQAIREIEAVTRALGIALDDQVVGRAWKFLESLAPASTISLQRDIAAGRASELDDWCGAVVRFGRQSGVPTPVHDFILGSLLPQELRARGQLAFAD